MNVAITSFNSGEMSPLLQARSDTAKHSSGCKRLENFIPRVSGALVRRPGMVYLTPARDETKKVIVVGLNFSATDRAVLEIGHLYFRVLDGSTGEALSLSSSVTFYAPDVDAYVTYSGLPNTHRVTPWVEDDIHQLQFCQVNDLIYVVHPDSPPQLITRHMPNSWTISEIPYDYPMLADENITNTTLSLSGTTLTASRALFTADDIGSYYELSHRRATQSVECTIDAESPSTETKAVTFAVVNEKLQANITAHGFPQDSKVTFKTTDLLPAGIVAGKTYYVLAGLTANTFFFSETEAGAAVKIFRNAVTFSNTNETAIVASHDYEEGQAVVFTTSGTLPAPLVAGTTYYAKSVTATTFQLAATSGGATINITGTSSSTMEVTKLQIGTHTATRKLPYPLATPADATVATPGLKVYGSVTIFTFGAWAGTVSLKKTSGEVIQSWVGNGDRNLAVTVEQSPEDELCLEVVAHKIAPSTESETWGRDPRFVLEAADARISGLVRVTGVSSDTEATVDVVNAPLNSTPTKIWAESAWCKKRGYPRAVCLHKQRLFFGGTIYDPQTIWASVIGDFHNFRRSTLDDGALALQIATSENNVIQWLSPNAGGIIAGTSGDEWTITADGGIATATNYQIKRQSNYGSEYRQALPVNEVALFMQRGGRKLREYVFAFERDGYVAPDLTLLADHITRGGIKSMALMQQPDTIVWFARNDGLLVGMTYERDQQVVAWHRHPTQGLVESVTTIYGANGGSDELWLVVKRGSRRLIERLDPLTIIENESATVSTALKYLDSCVHKYTGSAFSSVTGLDHLNGSVVDVLADGRTHATRTVASGSVTLSGSTLAVTVGLAYTSLVHVNSFEVPMQSGPSKSRKWKANRATLHFWQSREAEISGNATDANPSWEILDFRSTNDTEGFALPVVSGLNECALIARYDEQPEMAIRQNKPLPLNVLGLVVKGDFYGD
jgi:hypothetical protein